MKIAELVALARALPPGNHELVFPLATRREYQGAIKCVRYDRTTSQNKSPCLYGQIACVTLPRASTQPPFGTLFLEFPAGAHNAGYDTVYTSSGVRGRAALDAAVIYLAERERLVGKSWG